MKTIVAFIFLTLTGCAERDIFGDRIHRSRGSLNNLSPSQLDTVANGSEEQAQEVIRRNR